MEKIKVGISKCLLGEKVRYDGQHKHDRYITGTLSKFFDFVSYCPEVESGMSIPRPAMRLVGNKQEHRLLTVNNGVDMTGMMNKWIDDNIMKISALDLSGFIFKAKSPTSGMKDIKIYSESGGIAAKGSGLFAARFMTENPLLPVIDEGRLHDVGLRENFLEHVFVFNRWQQLKKRNLTVAAVQEFHQQHKYSFMSHSPKFLKVMGALVAGMNKQNLFEKIEEYFELVSQTMRVKATIRKNVNVLEHIMGYFKKDLDSFEKIELKKIIDKYHQSYIPLIVPLTLLLHYVNKYDKEYLKTQYYLNLPSAELMMRSFI